MNLKDTNVIFLNHISGSGGDELANIFESDDLFETPFVFKLNKYGRRKPIFTKDYIFPGADHLRLKWGYTWQQEDDIDVLKDTIKNTNSKGKIFVLPVGFDPKTYTTDRHSDDGTGGWKTLEHLRNKITNSKIITIDYPKSIHNCILKNWYKITDNLKRQIDKKHKELIFEDPIKAHAYALDKLLKDKKAPYINPIGNIEIVDIKINFENILLDNFFPYLENLLEHKFNERTKRIHTRWVEKQFKLYRHKFTDNEKFNECFGYNKLAPITNENLDLDAIDQTFLMHYIKTNNLNLPKNILKTTNDAIHYFETL